MDNKKLCEKYIELVKAHRLFSQPELTKILKKHNYDLNFECMLDLSRYQDYLEAKINWDSEMLQRMKVEYGYTDEYNKKMVKEWDDLEQFLLEKNLI